MQKLTTWKFHDVSPNRTFAGGSAINMMLPRYLCLETQAYIRPGASYKLDKQDLPQAGNHFDSLWYAR